MADTDPTDLKSIRDSRLIARGLDLAGADLDGADLSGLRAAQLIRADLVPLRQRVR